MQMMRIVLLLPLLLAAAPAPQRPLPLPPIPPAFPPTDGPAPTPDLDAVLPSAPSSEGPRVSPQFVRVPTYPSSFDSDNGYVSGSRQQEDPSNRRLLPSPGFTLELPFE
jgi:hypothetical protein